jgi:predicted dehydrogenase
VAVASSRDAERAKTFLKTINGAFDAKTYGSYADLVADPDVDIIYVATPHSHHFQNAMLALNAGKHVLCEKALTVTSEQARRLVKFAREKNRFLMEAVWTRYQPSSVKVRQLIADGIIGDVARVYADFSLNKMGEDGKSTLSDSNRLLNKDLAGGSLLDLGIYSLTWVFQILYHLQKKGEKEKPTVIASMNKHHTGVDDNTVVICQFPKHKTIGIATSTLRTGTDPSDAGLGPAVRIQGSKGEIHLSNPACVPKSYRVILNGSGKDSETVETPIPKDPSRDNWGHGFIWEADEAARCIRDGKMESSSLPHDESIVIMEVMEEALRQGGVQYPELITSHEFDPNGPLNSGRA